MASGFSRAYGRFRIEICSTETKFPLTGVRVRERLGRTDCRKAATEAKAGTWLMRVLKTFYLVALFSLSMGLFCGELPETLRLRDDTSNDYVNDSSASAARESEAKQEKIAKEEPTASEKLRIRQVATIPSTGPASLSGQELLQHLSIRRT